MEVEDKVELADAAEVLVEHLNEEMDEFEHAELVVRVVDTKREE